MIHYRHWWIYGILLWQSLLRLDESTFTDPLIEITLDRKAKNFLLPCSLDLRTEFSAAIHWNSSQGFFSFNFNTRCTPIKKWVTSEITQLIIFPRLLIKRVNTKREICSLQLEHLKCFRIVKQGQNLWNFYFTNRGIRK